MLVNDTIRDYVNSGSRVDKGASQLLPQEEVISIDEAILVEVAGRLIQNRIRRKDRCDSFRCESQPHDQRVVLFTGVSRIEPCQRK